MDKYLEIARSIIQKCADTYQNGVYIPDDGSLFCEKLIAEALIQTRKEAIEEKETASGLTLRFNERFNDGWRACLSECIRIAQEKEDSHSCDDGAEVGIVEALKDLNQGGR